MNRKLIGGLVGVNFLLFLCICNFTPSVFDIAKSKENIQSGDGGVITITFPDAVDVVVNKHRKLLSNYRPNDLIVPNVKFSFDEILEKNYMRKESAIALEKLFFLAKQDGIVLHAISGFRSEKYQQSVYRRNVETQGQLQADKVSAKPGHSEHQTGLTMDVSADSVNNTLETQFANTAEGTWLKNNAHRAGFIIRYLKGKEHITGYSYEPWHIRYVGEIAKDIYEKNITLEEYLNIID
ncbi:D-alanyl-D-alanine carboxypeptidase family protein [Bacillus sp. FDAARGOS_1420]|uniref:M15 family metallopeptidase n=1 Tax=unclassified Bacillus (in: firmicutes) TaxID=185979 RepID=UPI001C5B9276|nr:M15 family metallopeptidase [Bacillus sp. FDAARGOS_1420]MBW3496289.1 M15 family metallopeptidase [Bacillus sp. FDAARGOS_1420]